ncbi:MAG: hypothetical protein A2W09_04310 [Deltaproteobacteria bacterium RBG_16_50_11]|nr:MAG: hypothetical protein A2W09_04310 [Deltaproteobacteria bacterium RBG_16_50_11]
MNLPIPLILSALFIFVMYKLEFKWKPNVSRALWVPTIWLMIIGSRYLSYWLNLSSPMETPEMVMEGSPFDRIVFLVLNIAGIYIIYRRELNLLHIINRNFWIFLFFLFGAISALWSEIPYVLMKRLFKSIGNPVMALVVLSEPDPFEALKTVLRRCSYVLLPLSIICIKYYPQIGRSYSYSGEVMYRGVTGQKNDLGLICMIFSIGFFWGILKRSNRQIQPEGRKELLLDIMFLSMGFWLLMKSNSATSLVCFIAGIFIIIVTEFPLFKNNVRSVYLLIFISIIVFFITYSSFDVKGAVISSLGRNSTLTERVPLWEYLLSLGTNPIIGTGFESFWTVNRLTIVQELFGVNSVHNAYLEIYLNLGIIGLILFGAIVVATFKNAFRELTLNYDFGIFKLSFLTIILLYSYTEAYLSGINMIYFLFFFITMKCPSPSNDSDSPDSSFGEDEVWDMERIGKPDGFRNGNRHGET